MSDPWLALAEEGNFDLIGKLKCAVDGEGGFGTIVVDEKGFSPNDDTHNAVRQFLREKNVNVVNVPSLIGNLEVALRKHRPAFMDE